MECCPLSERGWRDISQPSPCAVEGETPWPPCKPGAVPVPFSILCRGTLSHGASRAATTRRHLLALIALALTDRSPGSAGAAGPEGQLTWGVHVSLAPTWFDPAEMSGIITPYMVFYALHDALVKPMPGQPFAPSLAKSWSASDDGLVYEFVLREGVKFHNGEPVTAEDVKFSFERYRGRRQQGAEGPGRRGRDPRSATRPLQAQAALARLHDLLHQRHGRGLDRAEEVRGAGRRRRFQEGARSAPAPTSSSRSRRAWS